MPSGSCSGGGWWSPSRPRAGSGDGCMELLVVTAPVSGDWIGEGWIEEAMEEAEMAEAGIN